MKPIGLESPVNQTKKLKEKPTLHKPFNDVHAVLEDIRAFNEKLFLCCLLTYGCLAATSSGNQTAYLERLQ